MAKTLNKEGKLVVFSESVDTLTYLYKRLKDLGRTDVLLITSESRARMIVTVKENFDANYKEKKNDYNIILTSDVLAEGVNLHRSNVIINSDSPWNSTRLMQRIGRVNRIGSVADKIHNFMFYPSQQGDNEIQLYKNALIKLQGFHSAFGEDAQIYSREEIVKEFQMFDSNVRDIIDKKIALLREVRDLYNTDRKLYKKIKALPMKSRVMRDTGKHHKESIVFVSSSVKTEFYQVTDTTVEPVDFLSAAAVLKADPSEKPVILEEPTRHYEHVERALAGFENLVDEAMDDFHVESKDLTMTAKIARKFLVVLKQVFADDLIQKDCDLLLAYVNEGKYARLPRRLKELSAKYKNVRTAIEENEYEIQTAISKLVDEYKTTTADERRDAQAVTEPRIIISETFK
jgi:superfamily II DNA/RNA helicase